MTTVTLTVGAPQPYPRGGECATCTVDVEGMFAVHLAYCSIIARAAPGHLIDIGVGVAAFVHNGKNQGFVTFPFGPGVYTLYAQLQSFDSNYKPLPSVDSQDVSVTI